MFKLKEKLCTLRILLCDVYLVNLQYSRSPDSPGRLSGGTANLPGRKRLLAKDKEGNRGEKTRIQGCTARLNLLKSAGDVSVTSSIAVWPICGVRQGYKILVK